jgi:hypothetical protein
VTLTDIRDLIAPLTTPVADNPSLAFGLGLILALFIAYAAAALSHTALTVLMGVAGLYWQAAVVALIAVAVWLVHSRIWPRYNCRRCKGAGAFRRRFLGKTVSRRCRCCGGAGTHIRLGRHLLKPIIGPL